MFSKIINVVNSNKGLVKKAVLGGVLVLGVNWIAQIAKDEPKEPATEPIVDTELDDTTNVYGVAE